MRWTRCCSWGRRRENGKRSDTRSRHLTAGKEAPADQVSGFGKGEEAHSGHSVTDFVFGVIRPWSDMMIPDELEHYSPVGTLEWLEGWELREAIRMLLRPLLNRMQPLLLLGQIALVGSGA